MDNLEAICSTNKIVRKRYEPEFIQQVVGVYHSGVYATIEECALAYGVHKKTLSVWLERHRRKIAPDSVLQ